MNVSWVTIIWSMIASACLMLAAIHILVWRKKPTAWAHLLLSLMAVSMVALAGCELWMMRAETPRQFAAAVRWLHVPTCALIMALVAFVRLYLRAGQTWLGWTVCVLRVFSLFLDFLVGQNLNYIQVTHLRKVTFLGESITAGEGASNPWMLVGQLSLVLWVVFVADATITIWKRGDRRSALMVGGSAVFFSLTGTAQVVLVCWEIAHGPITASLFYMGIVAAIAYEMSREMYHAPQLSDDLRESEARYRGIFEGAIEGLFRTSVQGKCLLANPAMAQMLGYASSEEVTREIEDTAHQVWAEPEERARYVRILEEQGSVGAYECQFKRKDGSRIWVSLKTRASLGPDGRVAYWDGFVEDITERRLAQNTIEESELRYRTLFESAPLGILLIGVDGYVRAGNPAQASLYGYDSPRQLEGLYAPLFVAEKDRERAAQNMKELLNGQERPTRHYTSVRRDGTEFISEVTSGILQGPQQEVQGYLCLTRDITAVVEAEAERQKMEVELRRNVERFRQVADIAGEFIWEVDASGLYTYASPSVKKILGYKPEDMVGQKHFYDLFEPSVREDLKAAAFKMVAARQAFRDFPSPNVSQNGKIVHIMTSGVPMLDPAGNLIGYRGTDTDVTERKQSEQEIVQQREELTHLSRVALLGELTGALAHELNQPLAAILSNTQAAQRFLARDPVDLNEVRDILADIVTDDKRASEVIRRLHLLFKKGEVQIRPLNLNEVVQETINLVRNDLMNRNISARTELAPHLPLLHGDRVQLQQVLLNLIRNGCDAMAGTAPDNRWLTIRTSGEDSAVHIAVVDCGAGLAPETLERVFEPFYTTKPHGLGLGLAVCRTIVTAHGGKLSATNNLERGATFHLWLPAEKGHLRESLNRAAET